jgi:hypothetical protein
VEGVWRGCGFGFYPGLEDTMQCDGDVFTAFLVISHSWRGCGGVWLWILSRSRGHPW